MLNAKSFISSWPKSPKNFLLAFNSQLAEPLKPPSSAPEALLPSHPLCGEAPEMDGTNHRGKTLHFQALPAKVEPGFQILQRQMDYFSGKFIPGDQQFGGAEGWSWEAADQFPTLRGKVTPCKVP